MGSPKSIKGTKEPVAGNEGDTPWLGVRHPSRKGRSVRFKVAAQQIGFSPEEIDRLRGLYEKPELKDELGDKFHLAVEEKCD